MHLIKQACRLGAEAPDLLYCLAGKHMHRVTKKISIDINIESVSSRCRLDTAPCIDW